MKTSLINLTLVCALLFATDQLHAQFPDWNTQGNNIVTNEWLGADAASTIALDIRHRGNYPILFSTNNTTRMRIAPWGNVFVGFSGFTNPTARLHVGLTNLEAATGSNFESTAIRADNRFGSEGNVINRGVRGEA